MVRAAARHHETQPTLGRRTSLVRRTSRTPISEPAQPPRHRWDSPGAGGWGLLGDAVVIGTKVIQVVEDQPREQVAPRLAAFLRDIRDALDS